MVQQKRLDYGFNGYQVPRAARSVRKRRLFKKKTDDSQMYAFDLLATVAGKLLLEGESSPPSEDAFSGKEQPSLVPDSGVKEEKNGFKPLEDNSCGQTLYERNFLFTDLVTENQSAVFCLNETTCAKIDAILRPASDVMISNCQENTTSAKDLVTDDCNLELGICAPVGPLTFSGCRVSAYSESDNDIRKDVKFESAITKETNGADIHSLGHAEACDKKPSGLISSVDRVNFRYCRDRSPCGSTPINHVDATLVNRDDDDNSSGCTEPSTRIKTFRRSQGVGNSKVRKFLVCKPCKITPKAKDEDQYNADTERCKYRNRKRIIKRQRSLRDYPFKKRKFYDCSSGSNSDEDFNINGMLSMQKDSPGGSFDSRERVIRTSTSALSEHATFPSRNSQVKLKIKSFRVPELFIEISETATVGSLKKAVLEAVNAVLGGGLRVGVLLQGKNIRDDNKTLLQTGISHDNKMDAIGFTLEPNHCQAQSRLSTEDCPRQLVYNNPQPLARYPSPSIARSAILNGNHDTPTDLARTNFHNFIESDNDSALSRPDIQFQTPAAQSNTLAPVMEPESLSVVPLRKSKRSDSAQRRIRRPFTVSEVEALVQAVEKLGTGRWRDVKLRAFDIAKHRTYVDLKDKWKTLVHTSRISPQQRRGEPVPQELEY